MLHELLIKVVGVLGSFPEVKRILIDGCFVGSRVPTTDVDVVAVLEPLASRETDWLLSRRLMTVRKGFAPRVELLWVFDGSPKEDLAIHWLQRDKPEHGGALKGIVELEDFR